MGEVLQPGARIEGRYVLEAPLGEGTFGGVWRARDTRLHGRRVAVKFLKAEFLAQPSTVARFEAEGEALAQVSHPNIVAVIDRGTWEGLHYLVTEFVDGLSLTAWIDTRRAAGSPPTVPETLALFDQLCAGIEAAHAVRIPGPLVHRDLKPDNVLVRPVVDPAAVKVVDFGIAQLGKRSSTRTGAMMGTPLYMAPEQAMGNTAAVGPWTDVFALGVIVTEMLTLRAQVEEGEPWWGTALHRGGSVRALLTALRPDVPSPIWDVVATCLHAQGKDRFQHAGALRAAMRQAAVEGIGHGSPGDPPFVLGSRAPGPTPLAPTPSRDSTLPDLTGLAPRDRAPSLVPAEAPVPWAKLLAGIAAGALLLAAGLVTALVRADHTRATRLADAGTPTWGTGARGRADAEAPTRAPRAVREDPALQGFLQRWGQAMAAPAGAGALVDFYAPRVRWHSSGAVDTAEDIARFVRENLAAGGSFALDLERSEWSTEAPEERDVAATCRELPGAAGPVTRVRARVTEVRPARTAAIGCPRLEGVYLVRLRQAAGSLRICHESWSLAEGICASCPTAPVCRGRR